MIYEWFLSVVSEKKIQEFEKCTKLPIIPSKIGVAIWSQTNLVEVHQRNTKFATNPCIGQKWVKQRSVIERVNIGTE